MNFGKLYDEKIVETYEEDSLGLLAGARNLATAQIARSELPADPTILDLGAGTGLTFAALAPRFPQARMIGVDLSARMLEVARRRFPLLEVHVDDACNVGQRVAAESVDLALAHFLTTFVSRPRLFAAARTTLRPGGLFSVVSTTRGAFGKVRAGVDKMLGQHGLSDEVSPAPESGEALAAEIAASGFEIRALEVFRKPVVFQDFDAALDWGVKSGFFTHAVEKVGKIRLALLKQLARGLFPFHDEYTGAAVLASRR